MHVELSPAAFDAFLVDKSPLAAALKQIYDSLKASDSADLTLSGHGAVPVKAEILLRGEVPLGQSSSFFGDQVETPSPEDPALLWQQEGLSEAERIARHGVEAGRQASAARVAAARLAAAPLFSKHRVRKDVEFKPWETLLPLEDTATLRRKEEEGTLLHRFLTDCSPTNS